MSYPDEWRSHPVCCLCSECRSPEREHERDDDQRTGRRRAARHRPLDCLFDGDRR